MGDHLLLKNGSRLDLGTGTLVVANNSAADSFHSDAVEMAVRVTQLVTQIQDQY